MDQRTYRFLLRYKSLSEPQEPGLYVIFGQFSCVWIRIQNPNMDPDLGQPNQSGSMQIRIRNTGFRHYLQINLKKFQINLCIKRFFKLIQSGKNMRIQNHIIAIRSSVKILQQRNIFARSVHEKSSLYL
jgi:hypothetical protein